MAYGIKRIAVTALGSPDHVHSRPDALMGGGSGRCCQNVPMGAIQRLRKNQGANRDNAYKTERTAVTALGSPDHARACLDARLGRRPQKHRQGVARSDMQRFGN
jgi:hypothetical protein